MDGLPQKAPPRTPAPMCQDQPGRPAVAETLEGRTLLDGLVCDSPQPGPIFDWPEPAADDMIALKDDGVPPSWLDVAEPDLTAEADPLSPAGDPDLNTASSGGTVTVTAMPAGSATEDNGGTTGYFKFTASGGGGCGPSPTSATANFTHGGSATKDVDYTGPLTAGTVNIPMTNGYGETLVAFTAIDDAVGEGTESVVVQPTGATANNGFSATFVDPATNSILDNDPYSATPTVNISAASQVSEDGTVAVTVTRSGGDMSRAVTVRLSWSGSATRGPEALDGDYDGAPDVVEVYSSYTFSIRPFLDGWFEDTETIVGSIVAAPTGAYEVGAPGAAQIEVLQPTDVTLATGAPADPLGAYDEEAQTVTLNRPDAITLKVTPEIRGKEQKNLPVKAEWVNLPPVAGEPGLAELQDGRSFLITASRGRAGSSPRGRTPTRCACFP